MRCWKRTHTHTHMQAHKKAIEKEQLLVKILFEEASFMKKFEEKKQQRSLSLFSMTIQEQVGRR